MRYLILLMFLTGCSQELVCVNHVVYWRHNGVLTEYKMYDGIKCEPDVKQQTDAPIIF